MTPTHNPWPVEPGRIEANWRAITIELDTPKASRLERLLRKVGLPAHLTRLMVATPALRRAFYIATVVAILISLSATNQNNPRDDLFALLLIAPLLPVLGVALAYGPSADPAHEIALATPVSGLRLVLTRAAAVLGFSTFWLLIAAVLAPGHQPMAFAWLLPSLGLTAASVALMTFVSPRQAAAIASVVWIVGVSIVRASATDPLAPFGPILQVTMIVVAGLSLAIAVGRRQRFDFLEL